MGPGTIHCCCARDRNGIHCNIWIYMMTLLGRFVFIGLVVYSASWVQAQSNIQSPQPFPSGQIAPSDSATPSISQAESEAGKRYTQQSPGGKNRNNIRSMLASGGDSGKSSGLCFQPGVGWQRIPQNSLDSAPKISSAGSNAVASEMSTSANSNGLSSKMNQINSDQCPSSLTDALAHGALIENKTGEQPQATDSNMRTNSMNSGAQDWLDANTLLNPSSSLTSTRLTMGLGSNLSSGKHFSQGAEPNSSSDSVQQFESHAYISPIKLRRMMRNAPDLETRLKLRRLSEKQKKKSKEPAEDHSLFKDEKSQAKSSRPQDTDTRSNSDSHVDK